MVLPFQRSECLDCINATDNSSHRLYRQSSHNSIYPVADCNQTNWCTCFRPYVADKYCHHVASSYGLGRPLFVLTYYAFWLPIYIFFLSGTIYLLYHKCTQPMLATKRSNRFNKRKPKQSKLRCNEAIVLISLILTGFIFRSTMHFVDCIEMFHILPHTVINLCSNMGTSCWLSSGLLTIHIFVRSTNAALRLRGGNKGMARLRWITGTGVAILFLYGTTSLVLRFVTRGTELGDRLVKFSNHFRVMIDGTVCLLMMFVAVWYGNQAVKLLGKNQRLFRPVTVRLSTDITQQQQQKQKQKQRKTARTEKKCRTRRQQIVSAWIIHIRQVVISILLLFLTVFSYSLLENGNKGALSYYIHNLLMTGFELCSIYNMLKIAEGSEISRWFSWAGWVRIFTGVEAGVENMKKKTMRMKSDTNSNNSNEKSSNSRSAANKNDNANNKENEELKQQRIAFKRQSSKFDDIFVRSTSMVADDKRVSTMGTLVEMKGEEQDSKTSECSSKEWQGINRIEDEADDGEWITYKDEESGEEYYYRSFDGRVTWTNPKDDEKAKESDGVEMIENPSRDE